MTGMASLRTLWSADGETILAASYTDSPLLPRPHLIERSNKAGWPDGDTDEPVDTMIALQIPENVGGGYPVPPAEGVNPTPLEDRHVTMAYLGKLGGSERRRLHQVVRRWLATGEWSPLNGTAQGWGTFNQDNGDSVLWMSWDVPGLPEMRQDLVEVLEHEGFDVPADHGYVPHETVAYVNGRLADIPDFPADHPKHTFDGVVVGEGARWTGYNFPLAMALRDAASMSIVAALESLRDPELERLSDEQLDALTAAGGLDRNRGNAERLRRYWTVGPGGMKIAWGTPGDWTRCVALLSKHLGPRAKGYCTLRHKEMTRMYTGDMKHRIMYGWDGKPGSYWAKVAANSALEFVGNHTLVSAGGEEGDLMEHVDGQDGDSPLVMLMDKPQPVAFHIPLLLPEGVESGDGRKFEEGVVEHRELPIPLLWQPNSMQGHDGSIIVGRIDSMRRVEGGMGDAYGVFDTSPAALEAVRLIREKFLRGVSADLDNFEAKVLGKGPGTAAAKDKEDNDEDQLVAPDKMQILKGRIMGATLVAKPAFEQVVIELLEPEVPEDGEYRGEVPEESLQLAAMFERLLEQGSLLTLSNGTSMAMVASAGAPSIPVAPPASWFEDPGLSGPTHLTITDDGRVFGHIAAWHVDHIGMGFGTKPPRSSTNYAYFRTGMLRTAEGSDVRVGQITLTGGHASLEFDARSAVRHYDDTQSAFADVAAGEDRFGIWVAGALRPEVTQAQIRAARASSPSGDWRPVNGRLELVAVCQVNVPGFPVVEARVASGQVLALVAAGAAPLTQGFLQENAELAAQAQAARDRVRAPLVASALAAQAAMARARVTQSKRRTTAGGWALPDGEFRIASPDGVVAAVESYWKTDRPDKGALRDHISMCARRLGCEDLLPGIWSEYGLVASGGHGEFRTFSPEQRKKLVEKKQAMPGGSYPIVTVADLKNAIKAYGRAKPSQRAAVRRHIIKRAKALGHPELIPSSWKEMALVSSIRAVEDGYMPAAQRGPIIASAVAAGRIDLVPESWDRTVEETAGIPAPLVASLRSFRRNDWDESKVARDDVGRFRKIYYRLREGGASEKPKVRAALRALKDAERSAEETGIPDQEAAFLARDLLEEVAMEGGVDERTQTDLLKSAEEMSDLVRRFEVRGGNTMMGFDQLPTAIQDALAKFLKNSPNLEERITKHFGPFVEGDTQRSVKDILNLLERVVIDRQVYHEGYDTQRV